LNRLRKFAQQMKTTKADHERALFSRATGLGSRDLFKYIVYLKEGAIPNTVYLNSEEASSDERKALLFKLDVHCMLLYFAI